MSASTRRVNTVDEKSVKRALSDAKSADSVSVASDWPDSSDRRATSFCRALNRIMNRQGQRPIQSVTNMNPPPTQSRNPARVQPSKPTIWGQPGLQTQQNTAPRDDPLPNNSWAQQAQQALGTRTTSLDLSSSSFPSLGNLGGQSQSHNAASSAWTGGPPQSEASRRLQSRQLGARQPPSQASDFFPADTRSSAVVNGPPGLVQRQPQLNDSSDPSRVTSPAGLPSDSRSPIGGALNGTIGGERPLGDSSPASAAQPRRPTDIISADIFASASREAFESSGVAQPSISASETTPAALYASLTEKEKFGMKGYLALAEGPNPALRSLARGQDLAQLGLNMNSDTPLLNSYTGPFAPPNTHPLRPLESEYHTPDCYTIKKVAPLNTRINSFSDETLFYMFYSMPRDYMQVLVAQELMERKWRYHMHEQMWMMRDDNSGGYAYNDDRSSEQGYYIWWDKGLWKKVRRAYTLRYADLDDMPNVSAGQQPPPQGAQGLVGVGARPAGIGGIGVGGAARGFGAAAGGTLGAVGLNGAGNAGAGAGAGAGATGGGSAAGVGNVGAGAFNAVPGLERLAAAGRGF